MSACIDRRMIQALPAGAVLLAVAGCSSSSPVVSGSPESVAITSAAHDTASPSHGTAGRILVSGPFQGGSQMAALVSGTITVDERGCLGVDDQSTIWPEGTTWDPQTTSVVLSDETQLPIGSFVSGGGGNLPADFAKTWLADPGDATLCNWTEEVAVFNRSGSEIHVTQPR